MRITEIEKQIEKQKLYLSDLSLFDPYASFTRLDRDYKGYLEAKDIFKFLSEMYPNEVYLSWRSPYREARADQEINASFGIQSKLAKHFTLLKFKFALIIFHLLM